MAITTDILTTINNFKSKGWIPQGNGGLGVLSKISDSSHKVYVTPHKLNKLSHNDLFLLRSLYGNQDIMNPLNKVENSLELSPWATIYLEVLAKKPNASCVATVMTKWSTLATRAAFHAWKKKSEAFPNELRLAHWGLVKDLTSGNHELILPIIDYADIQTMTEKFRKVIDHYPETCAILVRDYAMVVWEETLERLEGQIEALEYLCELQVTDFNLFTPYKDILL